MSLEWLFAWLLRMLKIAEENRKQRHSFKVSLFRLDNVHSSCARFTIVGVDFKLLGSCAYHGTWYLSSMSSAFFLFLSNALTIFYGIFGIWMESYICTHSYLNENVILRKFKVNFT